LDCDGSPHLGTALEATYDVLGCRHGHGGPLRCQSSLSSDALLYLLLTGSSTVEVAAPPPAVHLGPELALQLHEAPDPGAVGAQVGLDIGGRLANRCRVDAE
jgi:hypothetical protein